MKRMLYFVCYAPDTCISYYDICSRQWSSCVYNHTANTWAPAAHPACKQYRRLPEVEISLVRMPKNKTYYPSRFPLRNNPHQHHLGECHRLSSQKNLLNLAAVRPKSVFVLPSSQSARRGTNCSRQQNLVAWFAEMIVCHSGESAH